MNLGRDDHARARAATERLFAEGRLGARRFRGLQAHLLGCQACRHEYDRLSAIKRALEPGSPPIPADELALLAAAATAAARRSRRRPIAWRAAFGATAALGTALALLVLVRPHRPAAEGVFSPRGARAPKGALAGVRAFCLSPDATISGTTELQPAAAATASLRCRLSDSLQFTYTYPGQGDAAAPGSVHLWLLSIGPDRQSYVYRLGADDDALALRPGTRDQPIPASVRLAVRHRAGAYELVAVVASRPLDANAVRAAAEGQPVDGATAASALLELRP